MIPTDKVEAIVSKHNSIEKELSSGNIDPKNFADKSKEYSELGIILKNAIGYLNFKNEKHKIQTIYTVFREGRASPDETKIDEHALLEITFFESSSASILLTYFYIWTSFAFICSSISLAFFYRNTTLS